MCLQLRLRSTASRAEGVLAITATRPPVARADPIASR